MPASTTTEPPAPRSLAEAAKQDGDAAPEPPKRKRGRPPGSTNKPKSDARPRTSGPTLESKVRDLITMLGGAVMMFNVADGQAIMAGAAPQAKALADAAKVNPAIKRALEMLVTTSVYGQLAAAFAPTILVIARNHNLIPGDVAPLAAAFAGSPAAPAPATRPPGAAPAPPAPTAPDRSDAGAELPEGVVLVGDGAVPAVV